MTANSRPETAKIFQFPAGGRAALREQRLQVKPIEDGVTSRAPKAVLGGSWYHEEAIREAEKARKR